MTSNQRIIDLFQLHNGAAKLADLDNYIKRAKELAGEGNEVVITGEATPIWLYLKIAHALHGKARKLIYRSPSLKDKSNEAGELTIFDHNPY